MSGCMGSLPCEWPVPSDQQAREDILIFGFHCVSLELHCQGQGWKDLKLA